MRTRTSLMTSLVVGMMVGCSGEDQSDQGGTVLMDSPSVAATGELFDVSRDCSPQDTSTGVRYYLCSAKAANLRASTPSRTLDEVIRGLPYYNQVDATFACTSLRSATANWNFGSQSGSISAGGQALSVTLPVSYEGSEIKVSFDGIAGNVFKPDCKMAVVANYMYPDLAATKLYANALKTFGDRIAFLNAIIAPGQNHQVMILSIDDGIRQLTTLKDPELPRSTKSNIEQAISGLQTAKENLTRECANGSGPSCIEAINSAMVAISGDLTANATAKSNLAEFLRAEADRLRRLNSNLKAKLEEILASFG